jgi:hypothetical protein
MVAVGLVSLAAMSNHRRENLNALLSALHKPPQLLPSVKPCNVACGRALSRDGENVSEAVFVETGHRREIGGQGFALACFKLLEQVIHGLLDELLRRVVALRGALLVGRLARRRRIVTVRRGGCGVAAGGCCVSHDVRSFGVWICRFSALGGLKKDIHFMTGETGAERRCQLPKPEGARKRARRFYAARSCTSGVDRRSRTKHEASPGNECRKRWSSRRLHRIAFQGRRCGQETGPQGFVVEDAGAYGG